MLQRAYNFGAGPAMLPIEVIQKIQNDLFDWQGTGVSVMEIGHRTPQFQGLITNLQHKLRKLLIIPDNYRIILTTSGAQGQFDAIPLNLCKFNRDADYFLSGTWSKKAAAFAKKYVNVNVVCEASSSAIPSPAEWKLNPKAAYAYYCPNETVDGLAFAEIPAVGDVPLVADLTSSIAYAPMDYSKFGIAFASAQKNLGIAGVTLVIVRDDLLEQSCPTTPVVWNYKMQAEQNSSINTVPTFAIYVMDLMVDWMNSQGGVAAIAAVNQRKVSRLYDYLDSSDFYFNPINQAYRSPLNVPFNLVDNQLLAKFLAQSADAGLKYLSGHISVGGARASLYNAMPEAGVNKLIAFMQDFAEKNR